MAMASGAACGCGAKKTGDRLRRQPLNYEAMWLEKPKQKRDGRLLFLRLRELKLGLRHVLSDGLGPPADISYRTACVGELQHALMVASWP
jgi:hypothetical protein